MSITQEQLDKVHALGRTALDKGDYATYWALSLAVSFALDIPQAIDEDIALVERNQRSKP